MGTADPFVDIVTSSSSSPLISCIFSTPTPMSSPQRTGSGSESTSISCTIGKAFTAKSSWPDKDEFLDVIYWLRQVLGVVLGLLWGVAAIKGVVGLALFAALNAGILYLYFSGFQSVDEEDYGGVWELTKEGFMTSMASFLVIWIIVYTGMHFD